MDKASLNYTIMGKDGISKKMTIESAELFDIDSYTCQYKNDNDLINTSRKRVEIEDFIRKNDNILGKLSISYISDSRKQECIPVLYDSPECIYMKEDLLDGKVTEIEKARKLLFNSRNELFAKLVYRSKSLRSSFGYLITLTKEEYLESLKYSLSTERKNGRCYIKFSELLRFRESHKSLGGLRNVYEDMLEEWKNKIMNANQGDFYFYSRQFRILMKEYDKLKTRKLGISNLKVGKVRRKTRYIVTPISKYKAVKSENLIKKTKRKEEIA